MTKHTGFYTSVDGQPVHVYGDPNMSAETLAALQELARLAIVAVENGTLKHRDDDGEFEPYATLCWHCRGTGVDDPTFDGHDDEGYIPCDHCGGSGLLYFNAAEIEDD